MFWFDHPELSTYPSSVSTSPGAEAVAKRVEDATHTIGIRRFRRSTNQPTGWIIIAIA